MNFEPVRGVLRRREGGAPKLLGNIVRNWFADRRPPPDAFEDVHPDLLPSVRSRAYFEFAKLQLKLEQGPGESDYPQQVLADHLAIGLVYDLPDSMRTIVKQDLENWGVTFYEALEAACANLRQKEDPVFVSPQEGVYVSATGDNYDASRMILTDMMLPIRSAGRVGVDDPQPRYADRHRVAKLAGAEDHGGPRLAGALPSRGRFRRSHSGWPTTSGRSGCLATIIRSITSSPSCVCSHSVSNTPNKRKCSTCTTRSLGRTCSWPLSPACTTIRPGK